MKVLDILIAELKKVHGEDLNLNDHHYYLFFKGGVFNVYIDEDEKELKVDVTFSDGIKVYHSGKNLEDIINKNS